MAEFMVDIPALSAASGKFKNQAQAFRETANALLQATADLISNGFSDEAGQVFQEKITELKSWSDEMATIVESYAGALTTTAEEYDAAEKFAAKQFSH